MTSRDSTTSSRSPGSERDRGAILVLALIFVVAVGLVVTALATWATNDINNSKTFTSVEALHSDASGMMKMSIQYVRYNPVISSNQAAGVASPVVACWGGTQPTDLPLIDGHQVAVWCSTVWNPGSAATRTVTFYACPESVPASICTMPGQTLLSEVVVFDDYPAGTNAAIQALCTLTCGTGMTVSTSSWGPSVVNVQAVTPTSISFAQEPSPTSVGVATTAYVQVTGGSSLPISNEKVTLSVASGGTLSSTSTLSAVTNTSGIAVFNNIVPSSAGSIILHAVDGSLTATSTAFQVLPGANAITLSPAPTNPQVGTQVTVSATATSGDQIVTSGTPGIVVTSTTTSVCTAVGGTISLVGVGTCSLTFTDTNANYATVSASMTFGVVGLTPAKIVMSASSASVIASSTSNDQVTLTLESSSGAAIASTGTTTLTLKSSGAGYFTAGSSGPSSASITSATIAANSSSVTVYFGDETAQNPTLTASSGTLTPGTATITVTPGPPSTVSISATKSSVVASATSNDAVTLQLLDQFKNPITPATDTTLTLKSSGAGYFTAGSSGPPSASITSATIAAHSSSVTVYFGDETAQNPTLSASVGATSGETFVTVTPGPASQVEVSPATSSATTSKKSNVTLTVSLADQFGNPVTPTTDTSLSLASSGSGFFTKTLGGDSNRTCVTIKAKRQNASAFFGDQTAQRVTVTVGGLVTRSCGTSGLTPGTATITVTPNVPTAISVKPKHSTFAATNNSNKWSDTTTLQLVDQQGNHVNAQSDLVLTLTLSSTTAHVADNNGNPVSSITIKKGSSSVKVYLQDSQAEQFTLTASATTVTGQVISGSVRLTARSKSN